MNRTGLHQKAPDVPPRPWVAEQFARLENRLTCYVVAQTGDAELARDIVQEAFVKLCQQSWPEISAHSTAWLYKTCRNRVIDARRREVRMATLQSGTDVSTLHDRAQAEPTESMERQELLRAVLAQIQRLPERQQELLRLRLQEELSYKQIAEITGLSISNVGYLLHQALAGLRTGLAQG